jgi:large subunit ribosomal protein L3
MMINGLMGRKLGMTQLYTEKGEWVPVTVVEAGPCKVVQMKTLEKEGYAAAQLAFEEIRAKSTNKPRLGHFKKTKAAPARFLREFQGDLGDVSLGQVITVEIFQKGETVDVTGTSKGKGFQGVIKRYHYSGGPATHGSMFHRHPGSIGASSYPSRVWKGKGLPGHMGSERVTVQKLEVVEVRPQENLIFIRGAVPGPKKSFILIQRSKKGRRNA